MRHPARITRPSASSRWAQKVDLHLDGQHILVGGQEGLRGKATRRIAHGPGEASMGIAVLLADSRRDRRCHSALAHTDRLDAAAQGPHDALLVKEPPAPRLKVGVARSHAVQIDSGMDFSGARVSTTCAGPGKSARRGAAVTSSPPV